MPTAQEKAAFSERLKFALRNSDRPIKGATDLARLFNLQHRWVGIAVQSAHKWLNGLAIPTADKIATLAKWLNVSEHWLHYGPPPDESGQTTGEHPSSAKTRLLMEKIERLPEGKAHFVKELVTYLAGSLQGAARSL